MKRIIMTLAATLAVAAISGPAMADDDDDRYEKRSYRNQQIRDFFDCAFTPAARFHGTIVDAALATPELEQLANAVVAAGLVDVLNSEGHFTVYAPINSAFENIPESVLNGILGVTDDEGNLVGLQAVLTYHVATGRRYKTDPRRVFNNRIAEIDTVQGQSLFFSRDREGTEINQSNLVSCQPVRTNNGIVYLIDSVMLPQF